jgi:hypothetical protein
MNPMGLFTSRADSNFRRRTYAATLDISLQLEISRTYFALLTASGSAKQALITITDKENSHNLLGPSALL